MFRPISLVASQKGFLSSQAGVFSRRFESESENKIEIEIEIEIEGS